MMKHLKTYESLSNAHFENESKIKPDYNVGDTVVCRFNEPNNYINYGENYIVTKIFFKNEWWYVNLKDIFIREREIKFYAGKFISLEEWQISKYNL